MHPSSVPMADEDQGSRACAAEPNDSRATGHAATLAPASATGTVAESRKHAITAKLRQIPYLGPIRSPLAVALIQTPHRRGIQRSVISTLSCSGGKCVPPCCWCMVSAINLSLWARVWRRSKLLSSVKTPYTAVIVPNAQHNLTVQPKPNESFFWWKSAPGFIGLVVAWVQHQTGWKNRFDGVRREGDRRSMFLAEDYFSKVMVTTRPSRYTFPSFPRSNTNVVGFSVFGSS